MFSEKANKRQYMGKERISRKMTFKLVGKSLFQ